MKKLVIVMAVLVLAMLAGCSSEEPKPQEKPKGPELVTGRTAFQKLYVAAHGWARDAQPYRLESQVSSDANGKDGKSAVWRGAFASPSGHGAKPYIWSGTDASDAPQRGVDHGTEDSYSPNNSS